VPANNSTTIFHSNQYSLASACEHCGGVVRHERWCITHNPAVNYAYAVVLDAGLLSFSDRLVLHALGVSWLAMDEKATGGRPSACRGRCKPAVS
jgi:hypothetical protein